LRQNEEHAGQIDQLLKDLGQRPSANEPTELALWVGALINPLPGMGSLLMSRSIKEKILVMALKGIQESVKHMEGSKLLF